MNKKLIAIFGLIIVLCVALVLPLGTAFADYEDIVGDPDVLVNFNQILNPSNADGTYLKFSSDTFYLTGSNSYWFHLGNYTITNGHVYYCYSNYTDGTIECMFDGTNVRWYGTSIITANTTATVGFYFKDRAGNDLNNFPINAYCIDLTLMFGSNDNVPTLQQCQELFVARWYNYTIGTPVSINGLNAYGQGFADAYNSSEYIFNESLLRSMIFLNRGFKLWGTTGDQLIGIQVNSSSTNTDGDASLGINLPSPLSSGDTLTITSERLSVMTSSAVGSTSWRPDLYVGYYSDGAFVSLGQFSMTYYNNADMYNNGVYEQFFKDISITINIPTNISTLYINCNHNFSFWTPTIKASTLNLVYAIDQAYNQGVEKGKSYYTTGTPGYFAIYQRGYQDGHEAPTWSFKDLISASIDVPVQAFTSLFDFDILGVNMKTFYLSIFTLCVIFVILKLVL